MAATWPEESVPSDQAAAVTGSWARRRRHRCLPVGVATERRPWAASQEVRRSDPSPPHACSASKPRSASEILASRRSRTRNACSISSARGTSSRRADKSRQDCYPVPSHLVIVHAFDQLAANYLELFAADAPGPGHPARHRYRALVPVVGRLEGAVHRHPDIGSLLLAQLGQLGTELAQM